MVRKRTKKTKLISMAIDETLYRKSKPLIANRTADYEDYLRRRINAKDTLEMLQVEYEESVRNMKHLKDQIYKEMEFREKQEEVMIEESSLMDAAVEVAERIYQVHGVVGHNDLDNISAMKQVELADLKNALPQHIIESLVDIRENIIERQGTLRGE